MRQYLKQLEERGELRDVSLSVGARRGASDLQALMRHLQNTGGPALAMRGVRGLNTENCRILLNPFGSRSRAALMLGCESWDEARNRHATLVADRSRWIPPVRVDVARALCKQRIIRDVDLRRDLPHVWFGKEGAAYVTGAVVVSRDPETGERNAGWYRLASFVDAAEPRGGQYDETRARRHLAGFFWWNPPMSGIGRHIAKAVGAGRPLEIACAVLCEPAVHVAATTSLPHGCDELAFAGALAGRPVELVRCETVDLEVPANAEWIIEGRVIPGENELVGWHSNPVGYYDEAHRLPIVEVSCITSREDPYWYATMEMVPPFDHMFVGLLPIEGELLADLRRRIPEVKDVVVTPNMAYIVQTAVDGADKPFPGFGQHLIQAVWGSGGRWARSAKMVIVVGPGVNPRDWASIEWAIMTRVQPWSDIVLNRSGPAMVLDPSALKSPQGGAMLSEQFGIDATIKVPERHDSFPEVSDSDEASVARVAELLRRQLG